jgi:hypothetical protein
VKKQQQKKQQQPQQKRNMVQVRYNGKQIASNGKIVGLNVRDIYSSYKERFAIADLVAFKVNHHITTDWETVLRGGDTLAFVELQPVTFIFAGTTITKPYLGITVREAYSRLVEHYKIDAHSGLRLNGGMFVEVDEYLLRPGDRLEFVCDEPLVVGNAEPSHESVLVENKNITPTQLEQGVQIGKKGILSSIFGSLLGGKS